MSMSGQRRLELEQERLEALRLEQLRQECEALLGSCEDLIRNVRDVAVQQLMATELRSEVQSLEKARGNIKMEPEFTLNELQATQFRIQQAITTAEAAAQKWSNEQAQVIAHMRTNQLQVKAKGDASEGLGGDDKQAQELAAQAILAAEQGNIEEAQRLSSASIEAINRVSSEALDERVRRKVVKALLGTLKDMGFIVVGPSLDQGIVVLEGRLASGRRARFEVQLSGEMVFDLDGYEDRSCADDMQRVEQAMRDRFGVKLGPPQFVWKNPDRLSKGSQDLPSSNKKNRS